MTFTALMDSGADKSVIRRQLAQKLNAQIIDEIPITLSGLSDVITFTASATLEIQFGPYTAVQKFYIKETMPIACIFGGDFLIANNITINAKSKTYWIEDKPDVRISFDGFYNNVPKLTMTVLQTPPRTDPTLNQRIQELLKEFPTVARTDGGYGRTDLCYHKIEYDGPPIRSKPYRKSPQLREEINRQVQDMLKQGIIRPSRSPFAAPVVLDKKSNGKWRLCIDYTKLNRHTKDNAAAMHNPMQLLRHIPIGWTYSMLDCKCGFWQIPLTEDSIEASAFITEDGHYELLVMAFGLKNAPKTYQSFMNVLLQDFPNNSSNLSDDVAIFTPPKEDHIPLLRAVLRKFKNANISLNMEKCSFGVDEIIFLGHIISPDGIKKLPSRMEALTKYPTPKDKKDTQGFLGFCQWYSTFIEHFATIADPLYHLLRKNIKFVWGPSQEKSFKDLIKAMCEDVVLQAISY